MLSAFLQKPELNTSRQLNLDLLKAAAIVCMIMCHPVFMLGQHLPNYLDDYAYFVADVIFGIYLFVAHAFMFAMGFGIVFSKKNEPGQLIRRGIRILILAYVLNFLRYGIYVLIDGFIEGEFMEETVYAFVVQDILQFAGLALIMTGIFKRLRMNEVATFALSVVLSAAGTFLAFEFDGSYLANYLLGFFVVTTEEGSCFAFFNWYFFVAAGMLFAAVLRRCEDLDAFYRRLLCVSCTVMLAYVAVSIAIGPMCLSKNTWYYAASTLEALGLLSIDLAFLGAAHFLVKRVGADKFPICLTMSKNITEIYVIQWCVIGFVDAVFCYILGIVFSYPAMYAFSVVLIPVSYLLAKRWVAWRERRLALKQ